MDAPYAKMGELHLPDRFSPTYRCEHCPIFSDNVGVTGVPLRVPSALASFWWLHMLAEHGRPCMR